MNAKELKAADDVLMIQASQMIVELRKQRRDLVGIGERFLDLCPRMNDDDPIGPALCDVCTELKEILKGIKLNP